MSEREWSITNDTSLLQAMVRDAGTQDALYKPGPYWAGKAADTVERILRDGIDRFRSSQSLIGMSFADNLHVDVRGMLQRRIDQRIAHLFLTGFPFHGIFDTQVHWTEMYAKTGLRYLEQALNLGERPKELLGKYTIPYSLLGECAATIMLNNQEIAVHYLNILDQHDRIANRIAMRSVRSVLEIGGGFGANIHLLVENYSNIRKILYLDIVPTLYVGTQYLKAFYGKAVVDYTATRKMNPIRFMPNDDLEIICVAPWQLQHFNDGIDLLLNSHSFVEMPVHIVENYTRLFNALPRSAASAVALATYDNFNAGSTLDPSVLPRSFPTRAFEHFQAESITDPARHNLFYVFPGAFRA
jgi:putative sugar O-methyltransferase